MTEQIQPRVKKDYSNRAKRQRDPNIWISGPDEQEHRYHRKFVQQRNQAQWRKEKWEMSWEEWRHDVWGDEIKYRGRSDGGYYLSRIDDSKPWRKDNVEIKIPVPKKRRLKDDKKDLL